MPIHSMDPKIDDLKVADFSPINTDGNQLSSSTVTPSGQLVSISFYDRSQNTITSITMGKNGPVYTAQFINDEAHAGRVRTMQPAKPNPEGLELAVKAEMADMAKHPEMGKAKRTAGELLSALESTTTDVPFAEPADYNKTMASNFKAGAAMEYGDLVGAERARMKAGHGNCAVDPNTDKTMISILQAEGALPVKHKPAKHKAPGCE
jgi:hypothetical protein